MKRSLHIFFLGLLTLLASAAALVQHKTKPKEQGHLTVSGSAGLTTGFMPDGRRFILQTQ
jgi:hypothetical protein